MTVSFKPIGPRLLVKEIETDNTNASGLILTTTTNSIIAKGKVIKVSETIDELIKEDDVVYYDKRVTTPLELEGEKYSVIEYKHLQAIEEKSV